MSTGPHLEALCPTSHLEVVQDALEKHCRIEHVVVVLGDHTAGAWHLGCGAHRTRLDAAD
eukprot:360578-Chlamydomonas_euryale.AAC.14